MLVASGGATADRAVPLYTSKVGRVHCFHGPAPKSSVCRDALPGSVVVFPPSQPLKRVSVYWFPPQKVAGSGVADLIGLLEDGAGCDFSV